MATVFAYARVTHHGTYLVYMVYDHAYSMFYVQRNSIPIVRPYSKAVLSWAKTILINIVYSFGPTQRSLTIATKC